MNRIQQVEDLGLLKVMFFMEQFVFFLRLRLLICNLMYTGTNVPKAATASPEGTHLSNSTSYVRRNSFNLSRLWENQIHL